MKFGFVYALCNPAWPGVVKIGATSRSPMNRIMELNAQYRLPESFDLMILAEVADHYDFERRLHVMFADRRIDGRELFRLDREHLDRMLHLIGEESILQYTCEMLNDYLDRIGQYQRPDGVVLQ